MGEKGVTTVFESLSLLQVLEIVVVLNVVECVLIAAGLALRWRK